jgi:hypothetical protein
MRLRRSIAFAIASQLALSCSASGPTIHVQLIPAPEITSLDRFSRLEVLVARCDLPEGAEPISIDVPLRASADGATPETTFEVDVPPGAPFSVWLKAFEEGGRGERLTAEACSEWLVVADGEATVPLTLTSTSGLCPISRERCP